MEITLRPMPLAEKPLLLRLLELYSYEFSQFSGDDLSEYGYYGYEHLDDYWNEEGRYPYLIRAEGKIAGFALVCPHCEYRQEPEARAVGEFFVMLKYRKMGIGRQIARRLFDLHPGKWEVCCWKSNVPARLFWEKVIGEYTQGQYQICDGAGRHNMGFTFEN